MSQRRPALGLLLAVVGILATVACQASLPGSPQAARSSTPGGSPLLVAADARLYAGDYDGAEAAYKSLIGRAVPGAAAHYATQLDHILLAIKEQPKFPERKISLARYDLAHEKGQAAQEVLQRLAASHSKNYPVLVSAAASAFADADLQNANALYTRALQLRADG